VGMTKCDLALGMDHDINKVKQSQPLAMMVDSAVKNPMDFPLIGVIQLNQWQRVYGSVGDLTRASGLQQ